jgi:hypothetical protein
VKSTAVRLITVALAVVAGLGPLAAAAAPVAARTAASAMAAAAPSTGGRPVVIIGIPGLRWTDISAASTPALWRLAGHGSVGSLVVSAVQTYTCPADAWLTLNAGARAMAPRPDANHCSSLPAVTGPTSPGASSGTGSSGATAPRTAATAPRIAATAPRTAATAPRTAATAPGTAATAPSGAATVPRTAATAPRTAATSAGKACAAAPGTPAASGTTGGIGRPAWVPGLTGPSGIEHDNIPFSYSPCWGLLAQAAGPGRCAAAIGSGAALALASSAGNVASYEARVPGDLRYLLSKCPLTVADLGALPAASPASTPDAAANAGAARAGALRRADAAAGRIIAAAPAGAIIVVAGLGDDTTPHLRAIIVSGPGYGAGLLRAASTRQPGLVLIADLTPSVLRWRSAALSVRPPLVGSPITTTRRGTLAGTIRTLIGQDTAAQVYRSTLAPYFLLYSFGEGVAFGLIALILRGNEPGRRRRRLSWYRVVAVVGGSVPAGSFLASLVRWPVLPHPALLLYGLGLAWAAVIAAVALTGPWRHDPFGSPGLVGAVTVAVIGVDVITGSHLQLGTPFGLSALAAGRFYGIGNNAVGVYGLSGLLCAAWAGETVLRRTGNRARAVAAAGTVTLFTGFVAGWPAFGAKVGGTIAMLPAFLVLLAALAGIVITPRRAAVVAASGVLLIAVFAVLNFLFPAATGASDIGGFVGQVLHGGGGGILQRKIHANIGSLGENWAAPIIPVVVVGTGLMLAWPDRLRLRTVSRAMDAERLLRPLLTAMWVVAVLGWLADDSGVTVTAAALPLALPLVIAIVTGIAERAGGGRPDAGPAARTAHATDRAG